MPPRRLRSLFLFTCIFILAVVLRTVNLNWDQGWNFHPDELNIAIAAAEINFSGAWDPKFYAYGTAPIYSIRAAAEVLSFATGNREWSTSISLLTLIGRYISTASSILTVCVVYLLTRTVASGESALWAMFFTSVMPLLIQYAHFAVTESVVTLYGVLITYVVMLWHRKKFHAYLFVVGIILGAATATKIPAVTFICIPVTAIILDWLHHKMSRKHVFVTVRRIVYVLISAFFTFLAISSVTFIHPFDTVMGLLYERNVASGNNPVFYTYQFIGTVPYLFTASQFPLTLGYALSVLLVPSLVYLVFYIKKYADTKFVILFMWPTAYFIMIGFWFAKFVRYTLPIYPFIAIAVACMTARFLARVPFGLLRRALTALLFLLPFVQGIAFIRIYLAPQTRHLAQAWVSQNTTQYSAILAEESSEFLYETDMSATENLSGPVIRSAPHFELEDDAVLFSVSEELAQSEYYIIGTRRQSGVVLSHPGRFPKSYAFYRALFSGQLGYEEAARFTSYPSLSFGRISISFPDDTVEETFQVFDHPAIIIYRNTKHYDSATILSGIITP